MKTLTEEQIQYMLDNEDPPHRKDSCQGLCYDAWVQSGYRGTIEAATGVGKTKVGVTAVATRLNVDPNANIYIVVPTTTLRDVDWPAEFIKWGHKDLLKKVKIICYASMHKQKVKRDVDLLILDEIHHLSLDNMQFLSESNEYKVWNILGLTATLPKASRSAEDSDKRARIDKLAPSCFTVSLEQAIRLELVADFEIKVLRFNLDSKDKYIVGGTKTAPFKITEQAKYQYLTKMCQKMAWQKKDGAKFKYIGERTRFLYNLRSKVWLAAECMSHMITPNNRTLIFCGSIEQSRTLCGDRVYNSEVSDKQLTAFQNKEINYMAVVNKVNEGQNINELDQILVVTMTSNELTIIQRIGRTIRFRPGHKALVVILVAAGTADEKWYKAATENFDPSRITEYNVTVKPPANESNRSDGVPAV